MKKLFEVPYNFDESLLKFYSKNVAHIKFLYLPPYKEDSINTRSSIQTSIKGHCYMPLSRSEYEHHIGQIVKIGLRFVVLWQSPLSILNHKYLDYYTSLGASGFIIGNDHNAKIIKDYRSDLIVICSLVQRLRTIELLNRDFQYYDYIILYYTFNRALNTIKELSLLKEKIVIMPNTLCNVECPSIHHWFPTQDKPFNPEQDCWVKLEQMNKCGLIFPEHLHIFDEYVAGYKLQGREYPTEAIEYLCRFYFGQEERKDFIRPFLRPDMAKRLYELAHSSSTYDYYNTYAAFTSC